MINIDGLLKKLLKLFIVFFNSLSVPLVGCVCTDQIRYQIASYKCTGVLAFHI